MALVKAFLDGVGATILWIDFAIQAVGVIFHFLVFTVMSFLFPFCGKRDFNWELKVKPVPTSVFASLWLGGVFWLFWTTAMWPLVVILILELGWGLYALLNGKGERRREIFFHTLEVQLISVLLFLVFIWGTQLTNWRQVDLCQHHGNFEAWVLVAFLVLRVGLFPFHVNRLDVLCEMPVWLSLTQTIFNSWVVFQTGLLMKTVGFTDAFGDWSTMMMGWCVISLVFALGLSAVQVRPIRIWAHLYWILGHVALYVTTL